MQIHCYKHMEGGFCVSHDELELLKHTSSKEEPWFEESFPSGQTM